MKLECLLDGISGLSTHPPVRLQLSRSSGHAQSMCGVIDWSNDRSRAPAASRHSSSLRVPSSSQSQPPQSWWPHREGACRDWMAAHARKVGRRGAIDRTILWRAPERPSMARQERPRVFVTFTRWEVV